MNSALVALALLLAAAPVAAQQTVRVAGGPLLAQTRVRSSVNTVTERFAAASPGIEATVRLGRAGLRLRYLEAGLNPDAATTLPRDLVEAEAFLHVQATPWLSAGVGPRIRSFETPLGSQGWALWELRARVENSLVPGLVRGHAELGGAFGAKVNVPEPFDNAFEGVVGLTLAVPRVPVRAHLAYRLGFARFGDGARRETLDGIVFGVRFGRD